MIPLPPRSTLFPYTTLFRSTTNFTIFGPDSKSPGSEACSCFNSKAIAIFEGSYLRSEEHTSELQSLRHLVCRLLLEKKNEARPRRGFIQRTRARNRGFGHEP